MAKMVFSTVQTPTLFTALSPFILDIQFAQANYWNSEIKITPENPTSNDLVNVAERHAIRQL